MQSILLQFLHADSSRQRLGCAHEWQSTSSGEGTDPQQARLLLDVSLRPLIGVLMGRSFSASELTREMGLSVQRAHDLLGKLMTAGIAELDSIQPRVGRSIRRSWVSPRWFVPFEATGAETLHVFLAAQIMPRMELFVKLSLRQIEDVYSHWGFWLEHSEGSGHLNLGDPAGKARELFEGEEPFLFNLGSMHLSSQNATALKRRLLAVLEEFQALEDVGGTHYALGLLFAKGRME